jgi:transcriptional regulator with XRE-family HTH domain
MHLHSTESFATFGDLLRYLRRRERLTQRELGIAVGYSESQINRLEHNIRIPEPYVIAAQFIQALHLEDDSQAAVRLVELGAKARGEPVPTAFAVKQLAEDVATVSESKRQHGNNLPAQLTRFVGRRTELAELTARIGMTRLLTLTGAGG